jgi:hypothetical protein
LSVFPFYVPQKKKKLFTTCQFSLKIITLTCILKVVDGLTLIIAYKHRYLLYVVSSYTK